MTRAGTAAAILLLMGSVASAGVKEDATECFQASGDIAIEACSRVINSPQATKVQRGEAYLNRGQEYYTKKDYDRAIADFNRSLELNPKEILAYGNRGNAKSAKGNVEAAIADYTRAIGLDPNYTAAYTGRAMEYEKKGDKARAIADYKKAISIPQKYQDGKWAHEKAHQRLKDLAAN